MTLQEIKDKLSELCPGIEFKEVIDRDWASVYAVVADVPFRESSSIEHLGKEKALVGSYERLLFVLREHKEDPEGKRRNSRRDEMRPVFDKMVGSLKNIRYLYPQHSDEINTLIKEAKAVVESKANA